MSAVTASPQTALGSAHFSTPGFLAPSLEKSLSGVRSRDSAAGRGEGDQITPAAGPEKVTESCRLRPSPDLASPGAEGEPAAAGSYLSCFSESSACSGRWLALPQSQLLSRGCLPHCTRLGAPRPARLAAEREETGAWPIRAVVVGGAGVRAGRGRETVASWAGRVLAGWAAAGRDPLLEGGPHFPPASSQGSARRSMDLTKRDCFKLRTAICCRILLFKASRLPTQKEKPNKHGTILSTKSS